MTGAVATPEMAAAVMYSWLCLGEGRSPLLDLGSFAAVTSGGVQQEASLSRINVSVHVRMGDACDEISHSARSKSQSHFVVGKGRSCLHPSVYVATLRTIQARIDIDRILLATDSDMAVSVFRSEFGDNVLLRNFSRRGFEVKPGLDPSKWIERRNDVTPVMVASGLDDMRWLTQGTLLVGGMCSHFFVDVWLAASFYQCTRWIRTRGAPLCETFSSPF